jgi:hypothetical protein
MKKTTLLGTLTFCGFAALISCDNGAAPTSGNLADDDCPIGTFRPQGLADCVFPADDQFGSPLGVSDNRCATGQAALPPVCVSDQGGRTYFSLTKSCAPGYRFEPGACQRNNGGGTGTGGFFGTTGVAPTGGFFPAGAGGEAGMGGDPMTGGGGSGPGAVGGQETGMTGGAGTGPAGS